MYTAGDPSTKVVKTRKICTVPHPLTVLWILNEDGITWQKFFGMVYPVIVSKGKEDNYLALIQFIQQLAVRDPTTINCATCPAAPPRKAVLLARYMSELVGPFPGLRQDTAAQQHIQIYGTLGRMVDQQQAQYDATKMAKESKSRTTVAGWLGEDDLPAVLNLMHT